MHPRTSTEPRARMPVAKTIVCVGVFIASYLVGLYILHISRGVPYRSMIIWAPLLGLLAISIMVGGIWIGYRREARRAKPGRFALAATTALFLASITIAAWTLIIWQGRPLTPVGAVTVLAPWMSALAMLLTLFDLRRRRARSEPEHPQSPAT